MHACMHGWFHSRTHAGTRTATATATRRRCSCRTARRTARRRAGRRSAVFWGGSHHFGEFAPHSLLRGWPYCRNVGGARAKTRASVAQHAPTCCASHTRGGVEHCNAPHDGRCDVGDRSATVVWHGRCLAFGQNLKVGFGLHLGLFKPVCCSPPQPPLRHSGPFLVRAQRSSGIGVSVTLDQGGKAAACCRGLRTAAEWA
jgi:hypothetical protein